MMSFRKKAAILSATAGLFALFTALGIAFSPESRNARTSRYRLLVSDPAEIHGLEIFGQEGSLIFRRFGPAWTLGDGGVQVPVRAERIEAYLQFLGSVRSLSEVSRTEKSWEDLGLDDASARRIRLLLRDGTAAVDFRVGKYAPDGSRVFMRMEGNPRAYAAPAAAALRLPSGRKAWMDLRVFGDPVPLEDVRSFRVSGFLRFPDGSVFKSTYVLEQSLYGGWNSPQIPDPDSAAIGRLVRSWMNTEAEDFSASGLDEGPFLTVDLGLGGGEVRTIRISSNPDPEGWYRAALVGSGRYFRMNALNLKDLVKNPGDLSHRSRHESTESGADK